MQNLENSSEDSLQALRHSLAHLLAAAVMELWPSTKRAIGPAIDTGFYFDFEFEKPITDADLPKIDKKMRELLPSWKGFEKVELSKEEALAEYPNNPYKAELIDEFSPNGEKLSFYKSGTDYIDLCRGGHVDDMGELDPDSFKLTHIAGAYWRGDEKNTMLTRIYGAAFKTKEELDEYLAMQEEAKKRDHRKLGKELDLFLFSDLVGPGLPLFTPKGTLMRDLLDSFVWKLREQRGYERVDIPHLTKKDLYQKSGHWDKFGDELFHIKTREEHDFVVKPMNCPHHVQIFDRKPHSYREMPQRYASTTKVYRDEQTGELAGLTRVRSITQDDAHVFCRYSQAQEEFSKIWDIADEFYGAFGFPLEATISLHDPKEPEKYLGDSEVWDKAENELRVLAKKRGVKTREMVGEAAFYGPKIDFIAKDSIGRDHQVATIQLDMNMPERFDLNCINESGEKERIVMIHAAIMGSIERFMGPLIEHYAGAFPLWLSPVQVKVLPIGEAHRKFASEIMDKLKESGIRAELDDSDETLGKKIRKWKVEKVSYALVIGDDEVKKQQVKIESRDTEKSESLSVEKLLEKLAQEVTKKS